MLLDNNKFFMDFFVLAGVLLCNERGDPSWG